MLVLHQDRLEYTIFQHAGEVPLTRADGESFCRVIPREGNRSIHALFVAVRVTFILIEGEGAIRAGVNAKFNGIGGLFVRILKERPQGNDRAGPDE